jgi:thymidylate kinase
VNRVIIIEGADGSGKSTLAETLRRDHGFRVQHTGKPDPSWSSHDLFREHLMTLWRALLSDQPVVFDRHYLGEVIYGPIMRGRSLLSEIQVRLLERLCMAKDVKVVLCAPAFSTVLRNWQSKKEDYVTEQKKLEQIWTAYASFPRNKYCWYDYADDPFSLTYYKAFVPAHQLPRDVVGSPKARFLLVGEQVNTNVTSTDWAFFSDRGSSGFINEAIIEARIPETDLAFVNARRVSGEPKLLKPILDRLPNLEAVIALGRVAEEILSGQGIQFRHVPHPAYVKRFKQNNVGAYAQMLKEVTCSLPVKA